MTRVPMLFLLPLAMFSWASIAAFGLNWSWLADPAYVNRKTPEPGRPKPPTSRSAIASAKLDTIAGLVIEADAAGTAAGPSAGTLAGVSTGTSAAMSDVAGVDAGHVERPARGDLAIVGRSIARSGDIAGAQPASLTSTIDDGDRPVVPEQSVAISQSEGAVAARLLEHDVAVPEHSNGWAVPPSDRFQGLVMAHPPRRSVETMASLQVSAASSAIRQAGSKAKPVQRREIKPAHVAKVERAITARKLDRERKRRTETED